MKTKGADWLIKQKFYLIRGKLIEVESIIRGRPLSERIEIAIDELEKLWRNNKIKKHNNDIRRC